MTEEEYKINQENLRFKFGERFCHQYKDDPLFRLILECMSNGSMDTFDALRQCIESNHRVFEKLKEALMKSMPPVMLYEVPVGYKLVKIE